MTEPRALKAAHTVEMAKRCLCFRARKTARLITRDYDAALASVGLRATQLTLLCAIELRPDLVMSELADLLGLEQSTLSRNVAVLKQKGLLRAKPGPDRRQRELSLTPKGRALIERAYPLWQEAQRAVEELYFDGDSSSLLYALDERIGLKRTP